MSRRLRPALALPLLLFVGAGPVGGSEKLDVRTLELENGVRLLSVHRPLTSMVAAGWMVRTGSTDDPSETTGLAHLLEHLMFKGTEVVGSGELSFLYSEAGAVGVNASTLRDLTFYYATVPAERLELWFWLEADRLRRPIFRELEKEKAIVFEERRARIEAAPAGRVDLEIGERFWGASAYAWPPLGREGGLATATLEGAQKFFERGYRPDRLTLALVGELDEKRVARLAKRYFGSLPRRADEAPPVQSASFAAPPEERRIELSCGCPAEARVLYPTVSFGHPDSYPLQLLAAVLNGASGRLHTSLVLGSEIALSASAGQHPLREAGHFSFRATAAGTSTPADLVSAWDRELERILAGPISPTELERARNGLLADGLRRLDDPAALMKQLLIYDGLGNWNEIRDWPERILAVEEADLRRVGRRLLRAERRLVAEIRRNDQRP